MDSANYIAAWAVWQKSIPFSKPGEYKAAHQNLLDLAAPEHVPTYREEPGLSDYVDCSCGWSSVGYYDGYTYAINDWRKHVAKEIEGEMFYE